MPRLVLLEVGEQVAADFLIDASGVGARRRVNLILMAMHAVGGDDLLLFLNRQHRVLGDEQAAKRDAGAHAGRSLKLKFQDAIAVFPLRAEEVIDRLVDRASNDRAVFDGIFRHAALLFPAIGILPVGNLNPASVPFVICLYITHNFG